MSNLPFFIALFTIYSVIHFGLFILPGRYYLISLLQSLISHQTRTMKKLIFLLAVLTLPARSFSQAFTLTDTTFAQGDTLAFVVDFENGQAKLMEESLPFLDQLAEVLFKYDFLKIDCEGCEYDLLPKLTLNGVSEIVMEYHNGTEPLQESLRSIGFSVAVNKEILSARRP